MTIPRLSVAVLGMGIAALAACTDLDNRERPAELSRQSEPPEAYLPADLDKRSDTALLRNMLGRFDTDEEGQATALPALPYGMTVNMVIEGDRVFHGPGGCENCHGSEGNGLPARGSALTTGLNMIPAGDWHAIDSLVSIGVTDAESRSPIAMPARGQQNDLSVNDIRNVAAYVWAISQVRGEPWPGGHVMHAVLDPNASSRTKIP